MEPLLPSGAPDLEDLAREVISQSAILCGGLPAVTQKTMCELLRIINSYYSNLIEGHSTHPVDIEKAMNRDFSLNPQKRNLQMESIAHVHVQKEIERRLAQDVSLNVVDSEFLCWIHKAFFLHLPAEFCIVKNDLTGETAEVIPGRLRDREVKVGRHVGPQASFLPNFLDRFSFFYNPQTLHGVTPLIALAASHHRLMWIHPFLDGNGRVARLYTDAYFMRIHLDGYGLWNVSRGLARNKERYTSLLSWADAPRRNDLDGRGNLSNESLIEFCRFFLAMCVDQISFMNSLLRTRDFLPRINAYVEMRRAGSLKSPVAGSDDKLKKEAAYMLHEAVVKGEVPRGDMIRVSGMPERTARNILAQLLEEGLLISETPKGPVRFGIPARVAPYVFPDLYPRQRES